MPIPRSDSAAVSDDKLRDYLLNAAHPVGAAKARWFLARGFSSADVQPLRDALLRLVESSDDFTEQTNRWGVKYAVRGRLVCPDGSRPRILTVWILESGTSAPRFVTAYPDQA